MSKKDVNYKQLRLDLGMSDTILCRDKEDAKNMIDAIGGEHIEDWEFLPGGEVRLILNCTVKELSGEEEN